MQQKNYYKKLTISTPKLLNSIIYLLFLSLTLVLTNTQVTKAQPNTFKPVDGGGDKGGANGSNNTGDKGAANGNDNTPKNTGNSAEFDEYNSERNLWKEELVNESQQDVSKLIVNYDSLYGVYNALRKNSYANYADYTFKVYPNTILSKIQALDSTIYNQILPVNKSFSSLKLNNENLSPQVLSNLQLIDQMKDNFKFKTMDVFNSVLPPIVILDKQKNKAANYKKIIDQYFTTYPELIYLCSPKFVSLIEKNQYDKLIRLHKASLNKLDFRSETKAEK